MPVSEAATVQDKEWLPALMERFESLPRIANGCSVDSEQLYSKEKAGWTRGVVWSCAFQAGLFVVSLVHWKLRFFP
jgi:G:T-mismatch repair DNA endonuclease (very short patch repair protein)